MNQAVSLTRVMQGVGADIQRYRELTRLLEAQFTAALRHDAVELSELANGVTELVASLDASRRDRTACVRAMLGAGASAGMPAVFELLEGPRREALEAGWQTLEGLVRESKRLNARNCQLLMDQHALMQRVLHGEVSTYAPA